MSCYCRISLVRCLNEFLSSIWRFASRIVRFWVKPKSQTIRKRNFENSRGEPSSRRLVSSQRYLYPEWTVRHGIPSSPPMWFRFHVSRLCRRSSRPSRVMRQGLREGRGRRRRRRRRGSASQITRSTKLPLRRQVRGRPGRCSKSHYPRIIVFNSFSRRIISQGLVRPSIRSFVFFPPFSQDRSDGSDLSISRFSPSPPARFGENFSGARTAITKTSTTDGSVNTILFDRCPTYALIACRSNSTRDRSEFYIYYDDFLFSHVSLHTFLHLTV